MTRDEFRKKMGIAIHSVPLIDSFDPERRKYEEAYREGWNACALYYEDKLKAIAEMTGYCPIGNDEVEDITSHVEMR